MEGKPFSGDPQPDQKTEEGKPVGEAAGVAQPKSLEEVEYEKYLLSTSSAEETVLHSQRKEEPKKEVIRKQPVKRKLAFSHDAPSQQYQRTALAVPLRRSPLEECELGVCSLSITDNVPVQKDENRPSVKSGMAQAQDLITENAEKMSVGAIPKQNLIAKEKKEEESGASNSRKSSGNIKPWKCTICKYVNYETAEVCDQCDAKHSETLENRTAFFEAFLTSVTHRPLPCFLLSILETTTIELALYQKIQAHDEGQKKCVLDLGLIFLKKRDDCDSFWPIQAYSYRLVGERVLGCYRVLEPAEYMVVPISFSYWCREVPEGFLRYVLAINSSRTILAKKVPPNTNQWILADVVILLALNYGNYKTVSKNVTVCLFANDFAGCIIVAENNDSNQWNKVKTRCSDTDNAMSTRGCLVTEDIIPPLHRQVIAILTNTHSNYEFYPNCAISCDLVNISDLDNNLDLPHSPAIDQTDSLHNLQPM